MRPQADTGSLPNPDPVGVREHQQHVAAIDRNGGAGALEQLAGFPVDRGDGLAGPGRHLYVGPTLFSAFALAARQAPAGWPGRRA